MIWPNAAASGILESHISSLLRSCSTYYLAIDLRLFLVLFLFLVDETVRKQPRLGHVVARLIIGKSDLGLYNGADYRIC